KSLRGGFPVVLSCVLSIRRGIVALVMVSRRLSVSRGLVEALAAAAAAGLLAACASSSPAGPRHSSVPSPARLSASPASTVQKAPPSLTDTCYSTFGVRARPIWFKASDGVRLYGIEAG